MADCITPVIEFLTGLCGLCAKWKDSMDKLEVDLNSLKRASDELNDRYLDVKIKVETAEQDPNSSLVILNKVKGWMGRVEVLQNEVKAILRQGDEETQGCFFGGRCPKNFRGCCKLHKMVTQNLSDVNDLKSKGNFDDVAEMYAHNRFDKLPVDKAVGVESTFEELRSCFENNQVGIIGLYGMGGVGKTTLLKKFNNDFLSTIPDHVVIWVVASKDADPGKIQDDIRKKLRVEDDIWNNKSQDERTLLLFNILNEKKFVLLFDDVWERIDLLKLGVPSPNNHECKIILTTRSQDICGLMGAHKPIRVNCLASDKAIELFKEKVGETTLENPLIFDLAKQMVDECQGLPLALCTVGRAMANKVTPDAWKRAIKILRNHPSKVQGIVEDVYYLLEFSYDRLPDSFKSCFLYCALFPEDYNISKEDIILLWIAEGFLAEFDHDIHEARKQGEDIISYLNYACLLENDEEEDTIKMHDVIRDMALWVACDHGKKTRFFVRDCSMTSGLELYNDAKWKEVEKLSMWGGDGMITNSSQKSHCPNLITLLVRDTNIQVFPAELFVISSTIKVLDLSDNSQIRNLPSAVGDFVNLEYMKLSYTSITKLPEKLKNLKKLKFLLLDGLRELEVPKEVISSLLSLQAFTMSFKAIGNENVLLQELEGLDHLQDIRISVHKNSSVDKILKSSKLQGRMCELLVEGCSLHHDLISSLRKMDHLETLKMMSVDSDVNIPRSSFWGHEHIIFLRKLRIWNCQGILDLNWITHAPNLEVLKLDMCNSLVEVISEDFRTIVDIEREKSDIFSSLTYLRLSSLPELKSICGIALQFPCLKEIHVEHSPKLKKLPFNSQSALKNLRRFSGYPDLMYQLQWEDKATKDLLSSKFLSLQRAPIRANFTCLTCNPWKKDQFRYPFVHSPIFGYHGGTPDTRRSSLGINDGFNFKLSNRSAFGTFTGDMESTGFEHFQRYL